MLLVHPCVFKCFIVKDVSGEEFLFEMNWVLEDILLSSDKIVAVHQLIRSLSNFVYKFLSLHVFHILHLNLFKFKLVCDRNCRLMSNAWSGISFFARVIELTTQIKTSGELSCAHWLVRSLVKEIRFTEIGCFIHLLSCLNRLLVRLKWWRRPCLCFRR